jgi:GGDEF domain-containing protein
MGEDEFMIVLPETSARGANCVAQKLRQILAAEPVSTRAGTFSVTASITMTAVEPQHELDAAARIRDMLRSADRRNSAASFAALVDSSATRIKGGNEIN